MDAIKKKGIMVADICNTLFDSNTTYDFIRYCMDTRKLPVRHKLVHNLLLQKKLPFFWGIGFMQEIARKDIFKRLVTLFLKGRSVSEVADWTDQFYKEYLEPRKMEATLALLAKYDHSQVILASATLYPIAAVIAANLGITRFLATELEIKNGKYTGRISKELSGNKLAAFTSVHTELEIEAVITDNLTDKKLMEQARQRFAVCYTKSQEQFWSALPDVTILKVTTLNYRP